jgi:tetratricopeptide (TPR) repeat protein
MLRTPPVRMTGSWHAAKQNARRELSLGAGKFSPADKHDAFLQRIFDSTAQHCPVARLPGNRQSPHIRYVTSAMRIPSIAFLVAALGLVFATAVPVSASEGTTAAKLDDFVGPLSATEARLLAAASHGTLGDRDLLQAALIASGEHDAAKLADYRRRWSQLVERLAAGRTVCGTSQQQAQAILEFLHRQLLRGGYDLAATDVRQALDHGHYNCVSASVLFHCLAVEFGLPTCEVVLPGHVKSRVHTAAGSLDVETTCARWFALSPAAKKQAEMSVSGHRSPAAQDATPRELSITDELALIYYNRALDLLGQQQFAAAAAADAKAARLDPGSATIRGNLLATINNWAVDLGRRGEFHQAAQLLRRGLALDAGYQSFAGNYAHVYRQWIRATAAAGHAEEADRLTREATADPLLGSLAEPQP